MIQSPLMPKSLLNFSGKSSKIVHRGVRAIMTGDAYRGMASLFVFPSLPEQNRSACCASGDLSACGYCLLAQMLVLAK